jgi:hypothetical protein
MKFKINDKFRINDVIGIVKYINKGMAWLAPAPGSQYPYLEGLVFVKLDREGRTPNGRKAIRIK